MRKDQEKCGLSEKYFISQRENLDEHRFLYSQSFDIKSSWREKAPFIFFYHQINEITSNTRYGNIIFSTICIMPNFDSQSHFFMYFCPGTMTTGGEAINSDLQRGLDRRLRHITTLHTEHNQ